MNQIIEVPPLETVPNGHQPKQATDPIESQSVAVARRTPSSNLTPGQIEKIRQQLGVVTYNPDMTSGLAAIGMDVEAFGVSRIDRGALVVTQRTVLDTIARVEQIMLEAKGQAMKLKCANLIDKLAKTVASLSISASTGSMAETMKDDAKFKRAAPAKGALMGPTKSAS